MVDTSVIAQAICATKRDARLIEQLPIGSSILFSVVSHVIWYIDHLGHGHCVSPKPFPWVDVDVKSLSCTGVASMSSIQLLPCNARVDGVQYMYCKCTHSFPSINIHCISHTRTHARSHAHAHTHTHIYS